MPTKLLSRHRRRQHPPVADLAGEHLLELLHSQVSDLAVLIHDDGDTVQRHDGAVHSGLLTSFRAREDRPMSSVLSVAPVMPAPEPVGS